MKELDSPVSETAKVSRWRWIGHILRREEDNNCRVALTWTPEGESAADRRLRGGEPVKAKRKGLGWTSWNEVEQEAKRP